MLAMTTLDSEAKQATNAGSPDPGNTPTKAGENWDNLRKLTTGVQKQHRASNVRTGLVALLLILTFAFVAWALHAHLPGLVDFGKEVGDTVAKFTSSIPKPSRSERSNTFHNERRAQKKAHPNYPKVGHANSAPDAVYDPLLHPFYATALIDGRRVFLPSNDTVVVLDVASGRWTIQSESP
jgi:hypothetical protein